MLDLKRAIKEANFTQREVAEKLGITLTSLNQILSGNPTYGKLKQIAEAINLDVVDLFYDEGKSKKEFIQIEKDLCCPKCGTKLELKLKE